MTGQYDSSAIEVLVGLEPVRKRPGMFTQTENPNHLAQEVIDNSVDEVIANFAGKIEVTLHHDQSFSVSDDGRGIPVDIHQGESLPGVEVIMTRLHAGAKFSSKNYLHSGGLHGVGVSVVNALSTRLTVEIRRAGSVYNIEFANGDTHKELTVVGSVAKKNTGTTIRFWPDSQFFDTVIFDAKALKKLLLAKAVLCPGLQIVFTDEIDPNNSESWKFDEGLGDYLTGMLNDAELLPHQPFVVHHGADNTQLDCVITWTPDYSHTVTESYVNLIPTNLGGTHVNGFRAGITDAIKEFCEFHNLVPKGLRINADDVWKFGSYVLSVRMEDPQFSGQTKDRLSSRQVGKTISSFAKNVFSLWLNQHVSIAEKIAQVSIENARLREKSSKKIERRKNATGPALPGKLTDCTSGNMMETELFLVEGDSAGGSAKQARDRVTQAILPLRGKILNTWEVTSSQVLESAEVHAIAVALGVDPGSSDMQNLRYGKVCILADADSDGAHIATLLCALFVKHFRSLVDNGRVHVAMPPLYRVDAGKEVHYALDDNELDGVKQDIKGRKPNAKVTVQRFKGLGEMNPSQLKETTMNPITRRLVRLNGEAVGDVDQMLDMLLSKKKVSERKSWLTEVGNQAQI